MAVRRKLVRQLVEQVLHESHITRAPVDVERIAKDLKIDIQRDKVDKEVSGYIIRDVKTGKAVIGVNSSHPPYRQRFTVAHELGHFLLHTGEMIHVDEKRSGLTVQFRDRDSSTGENDGEREANLFAAELLMPLKLLEQDLLEGEDLLSDDGLKKLARQYQVSVEALAFRLTNLNFIKL